MTKIMKNTEPLFEVYRKTKGKLKGALVLHMSTNDISRMELIGILDCVKYQQVSGKGKWENTSKQNKTWKKRR